MKTEQHAEAARRIQGRLSQLFPEWIIMVSPSSASRNHFLLRITTKPRDIDLSTIVVIPDEAGDFETLIEVMYMLVESRRVPLQIEEVDPGIAFCKGHVSKEQFSAQVGADFGMEVSPDEVHHDWLRNEFHGDPTQHIAQFHTEKVKGGSPVTVVYLDP
jgi:hypothetical protein